MSKGIQALKSLEKIVSNLYGMDISYDEKTFNLFCSIGKELQALEIIKNKVSFDEGYDIFLSEEEKEILEEVLR